MGKPIPLGIGRVGEVGWNRSWTVERKRPLNHLSPTGLVGYVYIYIYRYWVNFGSWIQAPLRFLFLFSRGDRRIEPSRRASAQSGLQARAQGSRGSLPPIRPALPTGVTHRLNLHIF